MHFDPAREEAAILARGHRTLERLKEARPAGAAVEFGLRIKQLLATGGAAEDARPVLFIQRAGARGLSSVAAQHPVLLRRQLAAPLLVWLVNRELLIRGHGLTPSG